METGATRVRSASEGAALRHSWRRYRFPARLVGLYVLAWRGAQERPPLPRRKVPVRRKPPRVVRGEVIPDILEEYGA